MGPFFDGLICLTDFLGAVVPLDLTPSLSHSTFLKLSSWGPGLGPGSCSNSKFMVKKGPELTLY